MGAGFIQRFRSDQSIDTYKSIEGVYIIDKGGPSFVKGQGTGMVAVIGEFADMGLGVAVDASGNVTTYPRPTLIFGADDLLAKLGDFDPTLGDIGGAGGNGFLDIDQCAFTDLVAVPVNLCSSKGIRVWRQLPTNRSATDPSPVVPIDPATVAAGREFKNGTKRVKLGTRVSFKSREAYLTGIDGSVTALGGPAATMIFSTAASVADWAAAGVVEGDILVVGVIGAAAGQGANAMTLRVVSMAGGQLTVEKQDGTTFNWTTAANLAFRLHLWDTADSGGVHQFSEAGGYVVPARPIDATVTQGQLLTPTVVPDALTASSADALSGLGAAVHPAGDLVYTAGVQAPNVTGAGLDSLYATAINSLLGEDEPQADVDIAFASRSTQPIEAAGKAMTLSSYSHGHGRVWVEAPGLATVDPIVASGDAYPGAGFQRDESVIHTWPGVNYFQRKAVNVAVKGADGNTHTDGNVDVSGKGNLASVLSVILPERNPGEATDATQLGVARVQGYQRGLTVTLTMEVYKLLKRRGVCGLKWTKVNGAFRAVYQSGVTTSLTAGEEGIGRRRLAFYIQDSIAQALDPLAKQPISPDLREKALMLQFNFLNGLLSPSNPKLARIDGFEVTVGDDPTMEEQDILVTGHKVRKFGDANAIVVTSEIGENVVVTASTGG